jgi:acetoacetyl-CoA synthetase
VAINDPIWTPDPTRAEASTVAEFGRWLADRGIAATADYADLHTFSVTKLGTFWSSLAEFFGIDLSATTGPALGYDKMPGAQWFPGATVNYAQHALSPRSGGRDDDVALIAVREDGREHQTTYAELRDAVARARAGLRALGVGRGDRVVALAPNIAETIVAFLATASLGAIWSCCSPDFGTRAVLDRFRQIEPTVLIAVDGYLYGGKRFDTGTILAELHAGLETLRAVVSIPYLGRQNPADYAITWSAFTARSEPLGFEAVPFDHPLWVLYSSGTTGLPKGIVHGHGGIVLEHLKSLRLQFDLHAGERLFWFTTTGWMMWNLVVSGLLCGATVVLYDGSPGHPDLSTLWSLVQRHRINVFGVSAAYIASCAKSDLRPAEQFDLGSLRMVASTGAPLSDDGFGWVAGFVRSDLPIVSTSGGTDVCSAFIGGAPTVPVWRGELSCAALGAAVAAFDEAGRPVIDEVGELVITEPMPSMPVAFWDDPDGSRLRAAYFDDFPGVWRHGDWIKVTERGSAVIYGRSDATLNRGGVRMGTADLYAVIEGFDDVRDSLVIDTSTLQREDGELLCFVVLSDGADLSSVEPALRTALRTELSPRHVPDRFVVVDDVPRTLNGKKCEVPIRKILHGAEVDRAISASALANPESLREFIAFSATMGPH